MNGLEAFLGGLGEFEKAAVADVSEARLLQGFTRDDVRRMVKTSLRQKWQVRDACGEVLSGLLSHDVPASIISVSWSQDMIHTILQDACGAPLSLPITCNSFSFREDDQRATGEISSHMTGAVDKLRAFRRLREEKGREGRLSVFIGDSVTDLLALLEADIGIVLKDALNKNNTLDKVISLYGIDVQPLVRAAMIAQCGQEAATVTPVSMPPMTIYAADGWDEIGVMLFGNEF